MQITATGVAEKITVTELTELNLAKRLSQFAEVVPPS